MEGTVLRPTRVTGWRRIAASIWREPHDPQILGLMEVDATPLLAYVARCRLLGHHVTPSHIVGRAVALALAAEPDVNVRIVHGRARPRATVDVFFITAVSGGHDLSGAKIERADQKSAAQIAGELNLRAAELKGGHDPGFTRSKRMMDAIPALLLRPILWAIAWLTGARGHALPPLRLDASPFGSAMVSSVGMFGIPVGFTPLSWLYRVPLIILAGEIAPKAWVVGGRVVARPVLPLCATIDHRFADGWHIARLAHHLRDYLADPGAYEPALEPTAANEAERPTVTH